MQKISSYRGIAIYDNNTKIIDIVEDNELWVLIKRICTDRN